MFIKFSNYELIKKVIKKIQKIIIIKFIFKKYTTLYKPLKII